MGYVNIKELAEFDSFTLVERDLYFGQPSFSESQNAEKSFYEKITIDDGFLDDYLAS